MGGPLDNRLRFSFDVLREFCRRVGPDFTVGVRCTADEGQAGRLRRDDTLEISRRLKASSLVDFLNVVKGCIDADPGLTDLIPIQDTEVMAMNLVPYMRALQKKDVTFTVTYRLEAVQRSGNQLPARVGSDYGA